MGLKQLDKVLINRLEEKGLSSREICPFIRDVASTISANPGISLKDLRKRLHLLGWNAIEMDDHTLQFVLACFETTGVTESDSENVVKDEKELLQLMDRIYHERGFDFRGYSKTTLARRIGRRMHACGVNTYSDYARVLDQDPDENDRLFNDITINVTSFFRDKAAFKALERLIVVMLNQRSDKKLRIWSAGCATGEEPFTIAMLLMNLLDRDPSSRCTIIATDIDNNALEHGREGKFKPHSVHEVPPLWRDRYFIREKDGFRIKPALRDLVSFELHNLVNDPHYGDLDIVVCRNVIIYFNLTVQMQVINKVYRSLRDGGHLLLGRYEMLHKEARKNFSCVDFDARLYRKKNK